MDDIFFDSIRQRLYVIGGEGSISVIQRSLSREQGRPSRDSHGCSNYIYTYLATVESGIGARTGLFFKSRDRLYVAAPATSKGPPRLLVYEPVM